jgi:DNA-binding MarR family transcriptional regulator
MTNRVKKGFGMVSNTVMRDPELSLGEKALYAYLSTYANSSSDELFVAINKMASECNIGQSTVKRYLATLEKKKIISRVSRGHKVSKITILLK